MVLAGFHLLGHAGRTAKYWTLPSMALRKVRCGPVRAGGRAVRSRRNPAVRGDRPRERRAASPTARGQESADRGEIPFSANPTLRTDKGGSAGTAVRVSMPSGSLAVMVRSYRQASVAFTTTTAASASIPWPAMRSGAVTSAVFRSARGLGDGQPGLDPIARRSEQERVRSLAQPHGEPHKAVSVGVPDARLCVDEDHRMAGCLEQPHLVVRRVDGRRQVAAAQGGVR